MATKSTCWSFIAVNLTFAPVPLKIEATLPPMSLEHSSTWTHIHSHMLMYSYCIKELDVYIKFTLT